MTGPLSGIRVVELAGIGPGPHACMVLADLGADVVRVERRVASAAIEVGPEHDLTLRNRRVVQADLKDPADVAAVLRLAARADVLVEGFRPGVAERLGVGPDRCMRESPRLVYGRMTGWGQTGPLAAKAGHDINYIALTGVLDNIGPAGGPPVPPLNLVGDFGGGSMFLVAGILAALLERVRSGRGQVVDAAMVDGVSALAQGVWSLRAGGLGKPGRGGNIVDGSAPFYATYACADGRYVAVGAMESQFYTQLLQGLGLTPDTLPAQWDVSGWGRLREAIAAAFAARSRAAWLDVFADLDACVTPVLTAEEATVDAHLAHRGTLTTIDGVPAAAPAPRFSRSMPAAPSLVTEPWTIDAVLSDWAGPGS